jgi:xylulokinase
MPFKGGFGMSKYYIGFDCGTQSTKTAVYRDDIVYAAETAISTEINYPNPGWTEMDADHKIVA